MTKRTYRREVQDTHHLADDPHGVHGVQDTHLIVWWVSITYFSTGPKTPEGKARALANLKQFRVANQGID